MTSRNQGEKTYEYASGNLKAVNFPYVDKEHLIVLMETSNKEKEQMAAMITKKLPALSKIRGREFFI